MKIDPNELSFAGFAEEENQKLEEARRKSKEAPLDEHLCKIIIDYIYNNLINVVNGQRIDYSLADINPECQEIIEALNLLVKEPQDIFIFLNDYNQIKSRFKFKQELNDEKLDKIFTALGSRGYNKQHAILGLTLDILSEVIKKDTIKDMIARHNLEKKASLLTDEIMANQNEAVTYAKVMGEINNVLDRYGSLTRIKTELKDNNLLLKIKADVNHIIDIELHSLSLNEFEYAKISPAERDKIKARLENIRNLEPLEIFDVDNYGFIGLLLERRHDEFAKIQDDYEKIGERINKYLP